MKDKIKWIILTIIIIFISILYLLNDNKKEGIDDKYYDKRPYFNTKTDCKTFCKDLILKRDNNKCSYFNNNSNIVCYGENNVLKNPTCEYVKKNNECRYNEAIKNKNRMMHYNKK